MKEDEIHPTRTTTEMTAAEAFLHAKLGRCHTAISNGTSPALGIGSIMIQDSAVLPDMTLISVPYFIGWNIALQTDITGLDRIIRSAGWNLFLLDEEMSALGIGLRSESRLRSAMGRILNAIHTCGFNAAHVVTISSGSFLRIPYTRVIARAAHVQPGSVLQTVAERTRAQTEAEWTQARIKRHGT